MRAARGLSVVLAGTVLAALLAGCGSYTKADFIDRADAICTSTLRATRNVPPPVFSGRNTEVSALAAYLERVVPLVRTEARELNAVRRPEQDPAESALLQGYLSAIDAEAADYAALAAAAGRSDAQGVASAEGALRDSPASSLAARYGMHTCGGAGATIT
ncbi:MAG TPA: hypothetical protein VHX88_14860 [Solirubrobacteraceae bacterium]|nr:hypothetical protein [Solirubrobacteraceae bacterium]